MKKTFIVTAYSVYDITRERGFTEDCLETINDAVELIKEDDDGLRKAFLRRGSKSFKHHRYVISEKINLAELEVEYDDYKPTFQELCKGIVRSWDDGGYYEVYKFKD